MQGDRQRRNLAGQVVGAVAGPGLARRGHRTRDLRDQVGLPVGRRAEGPQMPRFDTVIGQRPRALGDGDRMLVEEPVPYRKCLKVRLRRGCKVYAAPRFPAFCPRYTP